jgi:SsrA-binding protein
MKKKHSSNKIVNRRAHFDYDLGDELVVGIMLSGRETKALRQGRAQLVGAYVVIKDDELWLINSTISSGKTFDITENEQTRSRKLLAHKKEIAKLIAAKQQGLSIIPTAFITNSRHIKLRIGVGRGKKRYDKRQTIKERDQNREIMSRQKI